MIFKKTTLDVVLLTSCSCSHIPGMLFPDAKTVQSSAYDTKFAPSGGFSDVLSSGQKAFAVLELLMALMCFVRYVIASLTLQLVWNFSLSLSLKL